MFFCMDEHTGKTEMTLAYDDDHMMRLKWYIAVLAADDELVPPSEKTWSGRPKDQRYCEYPDCPHYVFAELSLER